MVTDNEITTPLPRLHEPVSEEILLRIAQSVFGTQAQLVHCQPAPAGQFNTSYHLRLQNPDTEGLLRIAPPVDRHLLRYERSMMTAEPAIYDLMQQAGVPVPRVMKLDDSGTLLPRTWIWMEYIPSCVMLNSAELSTDEKAALKRDLGALTAKLHTVRGKKFGWPRGGEIEGSNDWAEVFGTMLREVLVKSREWGTLPPETVARIEAAYAHHRDIFSAVQIPRLVHNDIWDPNVLVRKDHEGWRIVALLDADRAMFADPDLEFILWQGGDDFTAGYGKTVDPAPAAAMRRRFYRLQVLIFWAWAYQAQNWEPRTTTWCLRDITTLLEEIEQHTTSRENYEL